MTENIDERVQILEQDASQINMSTNNLSLIENDLTTNLANLSKDVETLRVS